MRIRPSGSKVWLACPLGLTMQNIYGDRYPAGAAADEGTAAHWVLERTLIGETVPTVGDTAPNGVAVTADMIRHAADAADYVESLCVETGAQVKVEYRLSMRLPDGTVIPGTTDILILSGDGRTLHVIDYKYGHGHVPADSPQLKIYGIAAAQEFGREVVHLHVIQPRDYTAKSPRSYHFTPAAQNDFCDEVANALRYAHMSKPYAVAGSHCLRCPGRGHCETLRTASLEFSGTCGTDTTAPEAVAAELSIAQQAVDLATARLKGLQDEATYVLSGGGVVPGWALERKPGRQQWKASDEAHVLALADAFGVGDAVSKRVLITPLQAQKAGLPAELVKLHTERPLGEPKLVPAGETLAAKTFGA
jgi:hypothetical protein